MTQHIEQSTVRCAIYTRTATTQPKALEAQRRSAEVYVVGRSSDGWFGLSERYDDAGYSGTNTERPALRRLMADIRDGKIDCVVVRSVDHSKLYAFTDPAVGRFKELEEDDQEEFRANVYTFRNLYAFLSQIIPFGDSDHEKLYTYARFFLRRLPKRDTGPTYNFDDDVTLQYYRLQKISEGAIELETGERGELDGPTEVGTGMQQSPDVTLSQLIDLINERFATNFTPADQLFFDQIREEAAENADLRQAALANTIDAFKFVFDKALEGILIDRMEQNEELAAKFMNDADFNRLVTEHLRQKVYDQIRDEDNAA